MSLSNSHVDVYVHVHVHINVPVHVHVQVNTNTYSATDFGYWHGDEYSKIQIQKFNSISDIMIGLGLIQAEIAGSDKGSVRYPSSRKSD